MHCFIFFQLEILITCIELPIKINQVLTDRDTNNLCSFLNVKWNVGGIQPCSLQQDLMHFLRTTCILYMGTSSLL